MYFESFTPDKDIEFWCSGMTESVINALTKIGAFEVKSRNDVFKFKDVAVNDGRNHPLDKK